MSVGSVIRGPNFGFRVWVFGCLVLVLGFRWVFDLVLHGFNGYMCSTNFEGGNFGDVFSHGEIEEVEEIGDFEKIGDMILGALSMGSED